MQQLHHSEEAMQMQQHRLNSWHSAEDYGDFAMHPSSAPAMQLPNQHLQQMYQLQPPPAPGSLEMDFVGSPLRRTNSAMPISASMGRSSSAHAQMQSNSGMPVPGLMRAQSEILPNDLLFQEDALLKAKKKTTGPIHNSKYKAKLCKNWVQKGMCPYYEKCQFAHGEHEIEKWAMRRTRGKGGKSDLQIRAELLNLIAAMQRKNGGQLSPSDVSQMLAMLGQNDLPMQNLGNGMHGMGQYGVAGNNLNMNFDDLSLGYNTLTPSSGSSLQTFDFLDSEQKMTTRETDFDLEGENDYFLHDDIDLNSAFNALNLN